MNSEIELTIKSFTSINFISVYLISNMYQSVYMKFIQLIESKV